MSLHAASSDENRRAGWQPTPVHVHKFEDTSTPGQWPAPTAHGRQYAYGIDTRIVYVRTELVPFRFLLLLPGPEPLASFGHKLDGAPLRIL